MGLQQSSRNSKDPYASRWLRLLGYLIDSIVLAVIYVCIDRFLVANKWYGHLYVLCPNDNVYFYLYEFIVLAAASFVFLLLNLWPIYKRGQTIGKMICGTVVVTRDFRQASGNRYLFMRFIPRDLVALIPFVGNTALFLDAIAIFRPEKNRLFDDLAKTRVIRRKNLRSRDV